MQMSPPSCGNDVELPCPSEDEARLMFSMSALLDYRDPVEVFPRTRILTSKSQGAQGIRIALPELAPGSHCLLVTVTERPDEVVAGEFPSHGAAVVLRLGGGSSREHCHVDAGIGQALENAPETGGGCVDPVLSVKATEVYLERRIDSGNSLWLFAPPCGHPRDVAFLSEGAFASSPDPLRLRAGRSSRMLPLGPQEEGDLQAVVSPVAPKRTEEAVLTQPVVVGD